MRSIYAKILLWSLGTFVFSIVAFGAISFRLVRESPGPGRFFQSTLSMIDDEVCRAFEEGGPGRLADFIGRLDHYYGVEHHLTDAQGLDLVDGQDRSDLLARASLGPGPPRSSGGLLLVAHSLRDGRYRLLVVIRPTFDPMGILPYFGAIVLVIAVLGYALAVHLAAPLRRLRGVVDRFGRGELTARADSRRQDEIGELSRAFDQMASQIETLRSAERRLLQDVSHELRSPLARLGFNLELARQEEGSEVAFDRIARDLGRLGSLVDELLQLTRAEGDIAARSKEPVEIGELLESIAEDCVAESRAKGCRITLRGKQPATILGDRELLRRAFENITRNAIRHAPEGSLVDLELQVRPGIVSLTVRDLGPGVPADQLEVIFEPFVRVDDARSRSDGGVGLGLAIARRSVELHGGLVRASNANPGLSVRIELPVSSLTDQAVLARAR